MARPMPPVSPCAPWLCSGTSTPTGLARAAPIRLVALRSTTSMASSITPTGSTICSSPPPWEGENYEPRNPIESAVLTRCGLPLPPYLLADEKHSRCLTEKVYLPTIVSGRVLWHLGYTEEASAAAF